MSRSSSALRRVGLLCLVALVPVGLLAASSIVLASRQVTHVVDKQVQATAAAGAVVVNQETADLVELVHNYAIRSSLAEAVAAGTAGDAPTESSLASLAHALPGISASFVADLQGNSRNTYPPEPAVIGNNFSYRQWYKGLVRTGRPYVSDAIVTKEIGRPLAVTVTDYIREPDGVPVGILGVNYSPVSIRSFAANVGRAQGINLQVTDRAGTLLTAGGGHGLVSLARDLTVQAARAGRSGLLDYAPVLAGGGRGPKELSAYTPIVGTGWTVIASIPRSAAFAGLVRLREAVLAITALLVLILLAGVRLMVRSEGRRRHSELEVLSRERDLARVLELTDEGLLSIDATGAITAWNAHAEDLYGWSASEVLGRSLVDTVIPAPDREPYRQDLAEYRSGSDSALVGKRVEMICIRQGGETIPVEMGMWAHDEGAGFSAFVHDITDRVTMQGALETARDDAMQASRLKREFLANISHEIRTPMNGVLGMSGLLLQTDLDATQRDYAETIRSSADALLTVFNDILDFSKIEAGRLDVERVPFDLRSVVEESAVLLAARAQQDGLELTCRIDPAVPVDLIGDPGRLRQVLLNLLGNAVKFTPKGEVNLTVGLAREEVAGVVTVELSVRDTGIGMTTATLEHLYDAFSQADNSASRHHGGTGLGLAISRQLVELMGGVLHVTSAIGAGSTFRAVIPFPVDGVPAPRIDTNDLVGLHQLIVDDNATDRLVLEDMVAGWGCTAAHAKSASKALLLLRQAADEHHPFDVIILDLNLPDVDGYHLAALVRADPQLAGTPMILLTSSSQRGVAERTHQPGIVAYVTKPVRSTQLRDALRRALGFAVPRSPTAAGSAPALGLPAPATVLIVEDSLVNQKVLAAVLRSIGYGSDIAVNGYDALEALDRNHYAAVLMDCQMPVMDGYETTMRLREREGADRHTRVIAVTASVMAADRVRCLDAGMDDFLTKPIDAEELAASLAGLREASDHQDGAERSACQVRVART